MQLYAFGVSIRNICPAIRTILELLLDISVGNLPSETTIGHIVGKESNILGKMHVTEKWSETENATIHVDGTTDHQRHFLGYQISTKEQETLSLSMTETCDSDAEAQMAELQRIIQDAVKASSSDNSWESKATEMFLKIRNLMTDQHIVNKKFKTDMESKRKEILEKNENWYNLSEKEQDHAVRINHWFCHLHVLLAISESTLSAVQQYECILTKNGTLSALGQPHGDASRAEKNRAAELIKATCSLHPSIWPPCSWFVC